MQVDPIAEWKRVTNVYRAMYDDELINLVADAADLTEVARQVLDVELRRRRLGDLSNADLAKRPPEPMTERRAAMLGNQGGAPQLVLDCYELQDFEAPLEYRKKTLLCVCMSMEQAWQLSNSLKRMSIECWIEEPNSGSLMISGAPYPRVLVSADQLEQARAILSNPLLDSLDCGTTQEASATKSPECPFCGSRNPALEEAAPCSSWRCETCGYQWTEWGEQQLADDARKAS
jgi:hypothetical protein